MGLGIVIQGQWLFLRINTINEFRHSQSICIDGHNSLFMWKSNILI